MNPTQTKLKSHTWSIIRLPKPPFLLLCDGNPYPNTGPNHTIDFTLPAYDRFTESKPEKVTACMTSFDPDFEVTLTKTVPIDWVDKRLTCREWFEGLRAGTKQWLRSMVAGDETPENIKELWLASSYLHGFGLGALEDALTNPSPLACRRCGKPRRLRDEDAGTEREVARLCEDCFEQTNQKEGN